LAFGSLRMVKVFRPEVWGRCDRDECSCGGSQALIESLLVLRFFESHEKVRSTTQSLAVRPRYPDARFAALSFAALGLLSTLLAFA
jgi:hypothetical protein